ncbi:MAG: hypothetical protein IT442_17460 [Phycisphaeraceae bacterium]|nr:hypothetical protein [Phycisphaeraceae bacterium]
MSLRAVIVGLLLGLGISCFTYFNDQVIRQTMLIGNLFPVSVFGVLVVLLLAVNPLLGSRKFRTGEMAVVAALGLAACGWPGSGFFRTFTGSVAMPNQLLRDNASWQATHVMSYLPGGSAAVSEGFVEDWQALASGLLAGRDAEEDSPGQQLWRALPADVHQLLVEIVARGRSDPFERDRLLTAVNDVLAVTSLTPPPPGQPAATPLWQAARTAGLDSTPQHAWSMRRQKLLDQRQGWHDQAEELTGQRDAIAQEVRPDRDEADGRRQELDQRRQETETRLADLGETRDKLKQSIEEAGAERLSALGAAGAGGLSEPQKKALDENLAQIERQIEQERRQIADLDEQETKLTSELAALRSDLETVAARLQGIDHPVSRLDDQIKMLRLRQEYAVQAAEQAERHMNRLTLGQLIPAITPPPEGEGWLLVDGEADALAVGMLQGWDGKLSLRPQDLPWDLWWPTLRVWGGVAILMGLAGLLAVMVVHPQWSRRELLPYPIARFVEEVTQVQPDRRLPEVAYSKLFWLALVAVVAIHSSYGISLYFPKFVGVQLAFNFLPLRDLFPNASKGPMSWAVYLPQIYFTVLGLSFFLRGEVSLSLGLVGVVYMIFASLMYSYGLSIEHGPYVPGNFSLLLFGAWLGGAGLILYTGRRYYLHVLASSAGLPRAEEVPGYCVWAARGMILCLAGATWLLAHYGLDWTMSLLLVLMVLVMMVVLSRITAETGAFFIQPGWVPVGVLTAILGDQAVGPSAFLLLGLASVVLVGDPREAVMPYLTNAMQIADQSRTQPQRIAPWLGVMLVGGFVATLTVTLLFQYNKGMNTSDNWSTRDMPSFAPNGTATLVQELSAREQLAESTVLEGLDKLRSFTPRPNTLGWVLLGAGLVVACAVARLRLSWWPIHPVIFMVFGTMPAMRFSTSFFLGWLIKSAVVKLGGTKSYHQVRPLMIGMIAGEILAVLVWTVIGVIYYMIWETAPKNPMIFPG